ncbi:hypothetical protein [Flavobacterium phage FL-1]|nr:hypothetical protein [Flavobacterium phage FL-1]
MIKEEKSLAKWHFEKMKEARKYFDYADLSQNILEQQKDDDLLLLSDWFSELHAKLKPDDKRANELILLIQSIWRLEKYCGTLETICKASTVRVHTLTKRVEELDSQVKLANYQIIQDKAKYDLENETLKKQIEWTEKNAKK